MATVKCKQKKRWVSGYIFDGAALKRATALAQADCLSTVFEQTDILRAERPPVSHCKLT